MDSSDLFWLRLWQSVTVGVVVIALTIGAVTVNTDRMVTEMVKGGADPVAAKCAVDGSASFMGALCAGAVGK